MDKDFILNEIQRLAAENDAKPPGMAVFEKLTGIKRSDWYGKHWARWGDALKEAGFKENTLNKAFDREIIIEKFIAFIREIGRWPSTGDIRLKAHNDATFPHHNTFDSHLGKQSDRPRFIVSYCEGKSEFDDVIKICQPHIKEIKDASIEAAISTAETALGFVYLMKSGKYYTIGHTNSPDRRQYEIGLQLPEKLIRIHSIETDDPSGIEAYWHNRFKASRINGEWFNLSNDDIRIFRKRKFT